MNHYLTDVAKPVVKQKLEKRLYDKSKRQHGYLKRWEREYVWLSYDDQQPGVFCTLC